MLGVGPLDNRSASVQGVMRPEAQGSDPRAVPRVTGAGVRSYCRTSDRRRGLKGPGLPPPTGSPWGGLQEGVAPGASLSLALSLEEGLPGLAVEEGPLWEVDHPRPCPVAAKPEGSQSRVRVWLAGGWGREHRGSPGDPPSSGRGHGLIEAWGDSGPPHLAGSPMSGTWGQGRSRSPPPTKWRCFSVVFPAPGGRPVVSTLGRACRHSHGGGQGRGPLGWAGCCCPGWQDRPRGAQCLMAAWALVGRGRLSWTHLSRALLHAPPPVLGTLSPHPAPAYLLDPFFSSSHVASPLPLEVGPASNPVPQTGSPLGIW